MSRSLSLRAPVAVLALGSLAFTACGGDDEAQVTSGHAEVSDPGATDGRIQLPGAAEVGQTASASAEIAITLAINGGGVNEEIPVTLRLDYDAEVIEADPEGYVVDNVFTAAEILDGPDGADFSSVEDLVGVRYRETFNPDGTSDESELVDEESLTVAQQDAYEQFGSQVESTSFDYPDEPVGLGATWSAATTIEQQGFDLTVTYHYELTALDGDDYTIAIRYDEEIDESVSVDGNDADLRGRLAGGGEASGTVGDPLAQAVSMQQDLDIDIAADGRSISMALDVTVAVAPSAA